MGRKPSPTRRKEPSLELPSLRLPGSRRRRAARVGAAAEPPPEAEAPPTDSAAPAEAETRPTDSPPPEEPAREGPSQQEASQEEAQRPASERRGSRRSRRRVPPYLAAVVTGLLTGAAGTALTWGALRGCEAVTGTDSCGGGPGLLVLLAIVAVMVLFGAALLRGMRVSDPGGTSLLAVGIVCVLVLVGLVGVVFSQWMFVAMPALGAAAYVLAHWVTTRFVDTSEEGPGHDVR